MNESFGSTVAEHHQETSLQIIVENTSVIAKCEHYTFKKTRESIEIIVHSNIFNRYIGYPLHSVGNTVLIPHSFTSVTGFPIAVDHANSSRSIKL